MKQGTFFYIEGEKFLICYSTMFCVPQASHSGEETCRHLICLISRGFVQTQVFFAITLAVFYFRKYALSNVNLVWNLQAD